MRMRKKDLMDKLGVGYDLGAYDSCPWSCYEPSSGRTCSAEVRMDADGLELEAEIQIMYDQPPAGKAPIERICLIQAKPASDSEWDIVSLHIRNESFGQDLHNWQEKACNFFHAVVRELKTDIIPDIDELIDRELHDRERAGDQRQGGGGKNPKINAAQLLNMKKGGGF